MSEDYKIIVGIDYEFGVHIDDSGKTGSIYDEMSERNVFRGEADSRESLICALEAVLRAESDERVAQRFREQLISNPTPQVNSGETQ